VLVIAFADEDTRCGGASPPLPREALAGWPTTTTDEHYIVRDARVGWVLEDGPPIRRARSAKAAACRLAVGPRGLVAEGAWVRRLRQLIRNNFLGSHSQSSWEQRLGIGRARSAERDCSTQSAASRLQLKSQRNALTSRILVRSGRWPRCRRASGRPRRRACGPNRRVGAMATRLLIAYDGSTAAEAAVVTAGRLFAGARGCLLTVIEPTPGPARVQAFAFTLDPEIIQRGLEGLAQKVMDDGREIAARGLQTAETAGLTLEARVIPREGSESQTILLEADATDAAVIVCGSRGRGAVARSLLGSTSTSVLHHATRPVLVVPADPGAIEGPALIAYDGSTGARAAIAVAGRVLRGRRATIVNVWSSPMRHTLSGRVLAGAPVGELRAFSADYEQLFADEAASVVEEGLAVAREAGLDASGEAIESGSGAWRALAEAATDRHATVIVAGSRGRGGLASTILGSVSSGLVHNAETPVLIVRPES
jgi:nucleotide-binding universal stress UspA family protein